MQFRFGSVLKQYRNERGISQTDLASLCKISQPLISNIETNSITYPKIDICLKLSKGMNLTINELLDKAIVKED